MTKHQSSLLQRAFSDAQLQALYHIADLHIKFLTRVKSSFVNQKLGYRRVYLLDFQEIGSYITPYEKPNLDSGEWLNYVSIKYLLENTKRTKFLLPEGTILELLWFLYQISRSQGKSKEFFQILKNAEVYEYYYDTKIFEVGSKLEPHLIPDLGAKTIEFIKEICVLLASDNYRVSRLLGLLNRGLFIEPADLGIPKLHIKDHTWFLENFQDTLSTINKIRRKKRLANFADAINIMWVRTIKLQSETSSLKLEPCLITHTNVLYKSVASIVDDHELDPSEAPPMLWTPATTVYASLLSEMDVKDKSAWISDALAICVSLQKAIEPILPELVHEDEHPAYSTDLDFVLDLDKEQFTKIEKLLQPFYEYGIQILKDLFQNFENIQRENFNNNSDKLIWSNASKSKFVARANIVYARLSITLEKARSRIGNLNKIFNGYKEDILQGIFQRRKKKLGLSDFYEINRQISPGVVEKVSLNKIIGKDKFQILVIDNYEDFSSVYWKGIIPLSGIVEEINLILQEEEDAGALTLQENIGKNVYFQGIIAYIINQNKSEIGINRRTFELEKLPIELDSLRLRKSDDFISFLRINTRLADFCMHTTPTPDDKNFYPKIGRVVGIISKGDVSGLVSELFIRTSTEAINPNLIKEFVHENTRF